VVAIALVMALTTTAVYQSVTTRDDRLVAQRASVAAVLDQLPNDATITSIEAPQPLVLSRRTNPTRYQMFSGGLHLYVDDNWQGGLKEFRRRLVDEPTTLIAIGDTMSRTWREGIEPQYQYVGRASEWLWYARTSLGEATLSSLRSATGLSPSDGTGRPAPQGADVD
jgi:hypothetical protein